ncbi:MAG: hypothetical protein U9N49_08700 [Campylobacterota bacterium]|nr:hypothetical protein [Campylobacterota bacterium]
MYALEFKSSVKKDLRTISRANLEFIKISLHEFASNFNSKYERELIKVGKIKKLQGESDSLYRLRLRHTE